MDVCTVFPEGFLKRSLCDNPQDYNYSIFQRNLTENISSILEDLVSKIYRKNLQKTLQFTQILLPL